MQVQYTNQLDPAVLTAVFVTEESATTLQRYLPEVAPQIDASFAEPEATHQYLTPQHAILFFGLGKALDLEPEKLRGAIHRSVGQANNLKHNKLQLLFLGTGLTEPEAFGIALGETPILSNYFFKPYAQEKKPPTLGEINIITDLAEAESAINYGVEVAEATCIARDLVNEPPNILTAVELARRIQDFGEAYNLAVTVMDKAAIEHEKMGGLISVNLGSEVPPTFSIIEWKPAHPKNDKPIVLVGKGVTFDTGGISLKPPNSMLDMKADMGGAAAVVGTMVAQAKLQSDYHVIGLIPATDNRPGKNAYLPSDVITTYDGSQVEVINTDAEGRIIMADALTWAKRYDPAVVIDLATLTGSAVIAVGSIGIPMMGTANRVTMDRLMEAGQATYERLVELPLWKEYMDHLKSDVADLKNVGGREAGAITAGKFLEHFAEFPWIHLDIAGPAFLDSSSSYRPKNGTGVGVRLLSEFIRRH
jgi:leucyl aminopeptidase